MDARYTGVCAPAPWVRRVKPVIQLARAERGTRTPQPATGPGDSAVGARTEDIGVPFAP